MTKREFFTAVINAKINEELTEYAKHEVEKIDQYNETRKAKPSKKSVENAPIVEAISNILAEAENPMLASDLAVALGLSVSKVSALAKQIDGIKIEDVKVKGKGVRKAYSV